MYCKAIKMYCIDNSLDIEVNRLDFESYCISNSMYNSKYIKIINKKYDDFIDKHGNYIYKTCKAINNAFYHRHSRLKERIKEMLEHGNCIFLTLTFTDKVLNTTTYEGRRRKVREYLKSQSDYYIANIDFGEKNGREHYHAIILVDQVDYKQYKLGAINGRKISFDSKSIDCVSKYVCKLSNHALKKSTGRSHYLIYGKKIKELTQNK